MERITWSLKLTFYNNYKSVIKEGANAYPNNWDDFMFFISTYTRMFKDFLEDDEEDEENI